MVLITPVSRKVPACNLLTLQLEVRRIEMKPLTLYVCLAKHLDKMQLGKGVGQKHSQSAMDLHNTLFKRP